MRRRTLVLGAAAWAAPLAAGAGPVMRMMHPAFAPPRAEGTPGAVPMLAWRSMPAAAVMLDGKGPFTFGIDTGAAGLLLVAKATADAVGLAVKGAALAVDPSDRNPVAVSRYGVEALGLGSLTFRDLEASELPMPAGGTEGPLAGILGIDLFDAMTLTLDFKGRQVTTSTAPLPPADGERVVGYAPGPLIQLPLTIGDVTLPAHLDTGQTRVPLMAPQEAIGRLATRGAARKIGVARTVSQSMDLYSIALDAPVRIGAVRLPIAEVAYPTVVPIANLGSLALQAMTVAIDRVNRRVRFAV
jgi:hypothetical protein